MTQFFFGDCQSYFSKFYNRQKNIVPTFNWFFLLQSKLTKHQRIGSNVLSAILFRAHAGRNLFFLKNQKSLVFWTSFGKTHSFWIFAFIRWHLPDNTWKFFGKENSEQSFNWCFFLLCLVQISGAIRRINEHCSTARTEQVQCFADLD